jgi:hypothetical protein
MVEYGLIFFVWLAAAHMLLHKSTEHSIPERCRRFALGEWQQLWAEARKHEEKELRAKAGAGSKLEGLDAGAGRTRGALAGPGLRAAPRHAAPHEHQGRMPRHGRRAG